jgi:peptidoglycan/LPS O-acetylase OafA/YrhL
MKDIILNSDPNSKGLHFMQAKVVDTIRAIAIFCVLAHHLHAYSGFSIPYLDLNGGLIGVQLFFLISGYLIIQSAIKYQVRVFLIHRFFRIFPPYLAAFFIFSFGSYFFVNSYKQAVDVNWPYLILNLTNLQFLHPVSILQLDRLHVGWSLTIELFWYLLAPVILLLIGKGENFKKRWTAVLFVSILISMIWVYFASNGYFNNFYRSSFSIVGVTPDSSLFRHSIIDNAPPAQFMYFIIGASLYMFREELSRVPNYVFLLMSFSVLLFIPQWNFFLELYPNFLTGFGCAAFILWIFRFEIYDEFTQWLAKVSYSIYLIHAPIMLIVFKYFSITGWMGLVLSLSAIAIFAEMGWRLIEAPSQRLGRKLSLSASN